MDTKDQIRDEIHALAGWVDFHEGDVDASAFCDACDEIALKALRAVGVGRLPCGLIRGVPTLDVACAALNMSIPGVWLGLRLPGIREFREALD